MKVTFSEVESLADAAMAQGLASCLIDMGLTVDAPRLSFALSVQPVNTPADVPVAVPGTPSGASAPGADGIHNGDLCLHCLRHQLPYWREDVKNTARACQSCGKTDERPKARVGC